MDAMIETQDLSRFYEQRPAFERLTLAIAPGETYGLLGPMGSGCSTLLKVLAALLPPSGGQARVAGWSILGDPAEVRARVGYQPGAFGAYEDMRVWEYLEFFGLAYRVDRGWLPGRIDELLALAGLARQRDDYIAALSVESRQRLGLVKDADSRSAGFVAGRPGDGTGPGGTGAAPRADWTDQDFGQDGADLFQPGAVDLAGICDRLGVMHRGRLLLEGPAEKILRGLAGERLIELEVAGDEAAVCAAIQAHPAVRQAVLNGGKVVISLGGRHAGLRPGDRRAFGARVAHCRLARTRDPAGGFAGADGETGTECGMRNAECGMMPVGNRDTQRKKQVLVSRLQAGMESQPKLQRTMENIIVYEWRKMTPEDRENALERRQAKLHPWHKPPHKGEHEASFHLTAACYEHRMIIGYSLNRIEAFETELLETVHPCLKEIYAWSILPNHYLICCFERRKY